MALNKLANYLNTHLANAINYFDPQNGVADTIRHSTFQANQNGAPVFGTQSYAAMPQTGARTTTLANVTGEQYGPSPDPFSTALQSAGVGSSAAAAPASDPSITYLNGQPFDLSDPTQRQNYFAAANAANISQANSNYGLQHGNIQTSRQNLQAADASALADIDNQLKQLGVDQTNYFQGVDKQQSDFTDQYGRGKVQNDQNFAALSPNAFQSSQGTVGAYADNQFLTGLGDLQKARQTATDQFGNQTNDLNGQRGTIGTQYEADQNALTQQDQQFAAQRDQTLSQAQDQLLGSLGQADANQGLTDYGSRYAVTPYNTASTPTVDLSGYLPYGSLTGTPTYQNATNKFNVTPTASLNPLSSYLGYTPNQNQKDALSNYFKTGVIA